MTTQISSISPMYHVRPFELSNEPLYPSSSGMYHMRPYFPVQSPSSTSLEMNSQESNGYSSDTSAIQQLESVHLNIEKELALLKTRVDACSKKLFPAEKNSEVEVSKQDKPSHFAELEKKQETIKQQLSALKQEMTTFKQQRKTGSARSTPEPPRNSGVIPPDIPVDAVIKCHPDRPPTATFLVFSHLQEFTPVSWRTLFHSSLSDPVPHLSSALRHVQKRDKPRLILTVIWRGELAEPSLQVSPAHTPIYGDHNIAKYLCRLHADYLYEGLGAVQATETDQWVNSFSTQLLAGSSKERQNVFKALNAHFGKSRWLVGDQMSLADFVAFSLLTNEEVVGEGKIQKNVIEWIKLTSKEVPFSLPNLQPFFNIPPS